MGAGQNHSKSRAPHFPAPAGQNELLRVIELRVKAHPLAVPWAPSGSAESLAPKKLKIGRPNTVPILHIV